MIEPSKSPWACGVVMAKKKGDQLRFCCDFRYLNSVTVKDAYPIPRIDESISKLGDAKFFTTLDLGSAFWQVPLRKQDREKTGFACELGLFQWKRMPFGLCNATATFQRLMAHALIGVTKKYGNLVVCYVDDVVIATPTLEDHIERLDEVFACMKRSGLKCKPSKCEILKDSIKYLGRMVDKHGIRPDPDAVEAVLTWKSPKTEHQLMSFLGFANYYREFIKGYADKVYPMQQLMRHKGKKFTWNNAAEESFQRIKKELCEAPVLGMPTEKGMYVLDTDASVVAISGILHQEQEWNGRTVLRPIAYGSKVLSDTEMKYGAPKAEMFAVVTFVEKYRAYLGSEPFKLRVDNRALSWLKTYSMDQSYIGRWIVRLDGYNKIIEHRTRDKHQNADSLSKKTEFYERQEQREADRPEIKDGFSFMDKETYDSLPLTRWLDKSGKPIEDHPELPKEHPERTILRKSKGIPIEIMLRSKIVRETLKAKGYDLKQVETGSAPIDDLTRLLEKLSDDKPMIQEKGQEELEVTILRKQETMNNTDSSIGDVADSKDVARSLVDKIPEEILEQTKVRKKKVAFKEEAEHLGLDQESGEYSNFMEEEENGEGKLSGEREEWDEDSDESSEDQDSLCMILAEEKIRQHDRELQTDPSSGTYNLDIQEVRGGEELEEIAVSRKPFRELSCNSNVRTNLVPEDDMRIVKRIICVKLSDDIHNPGEMNGQIMALKEHVKARYRLSDLIRAQKNDKMTSNLSKWIQSGIKEKGELEEDSYKILSQFYKEKKDLLYHTADGVVACKRRDEEKILHKHNLIILPQLYQTEVLFRSHEQMEREGFPDNTSDDGIHFDKPKGVEWLNNVFQRHINALEADLLETAQFTFGPPPNPPFSASRPLSSRLGQRVDSRDSSRSNQPRLPSVTPMESEEVRSSTPPSSVISSVVVAESKREERSVEAARLKYAEKVKKLDLEDLECRQELAEILGIDRVSHEDLSRHHCVGWLKAHEAHFSRAKLMETADLTGIPMKTIMGPVNYRPLKLLGSPGLISEPPKHRTNIARIRLATPAQLRVVDKLLNPGEMELPDAAYEGSKLATDPRYGKPCGSTQLAKTLAVYDRADPAAARVVIVAGSDFEGTSPKLFWPETLIYSLPGAELNQMLTLVVALKSEMPCEPELLLFAGMNDHLHAAGLLEQLRAGEPTPRKIWEAIQTLFAAMNEVQENVASRFGS